MHGDYRRTKLFDTNNKKRDVKFDGIHDLKTLYS